ncbi:hypothetical protein AAFF_G00263060 [Aldrovandia affinis]|uniref:Uncharacterized protein n=1 Tax=Aldrovandia affinis TaxID=143900 RepID=A0AAD7STV0_9TELE|nr:hypothetical protein AAFF_G00263060 [Aldrovandia affinis]
MKDGRKYTREEGATADRKQRPQDEGLHTSVLPAAQESGLSPGLPWYQGAGCSRTGPGGLSPAHLPDLDGMPADLTCRSGLALCPGKMSAPAVAGFNGGAPEEERDLSGVNEDLCGVCAVRTLVKSWQGNDYINKTALWGCLAPPPALRHGDVALVYGPLRAALTLARISSSSLTVGSKAGQRGGDQWCRAKPRDGETCQA